MQRVVWLPFILDYIAHSVVTFLEHFQLKYVLIIVGRKKEGLIISIFDIQDIHKNTVRVDFMLDIFPKLSHVNMIFDGSGTMDFLSVFSLLWFFVKKTL